MKPSELIEKLNNGELDKYSALYADISAAKLRIIEAINAFTAKFGSDRDIAVFSTPGRSEIIGNHTDHNCGKVMAGAINRDIIAIAAKNTDGVVRFFSEKYPLDTIRLADSKSPLNFKKFTSRALIGGMANAFVNAGYAIGGYDMYTCTEVLKGSGLSSSAAFEVLVGSIFNHFYNAGRVDNREIAKYAQYAENVYFGKPCGLMDQMACAVGGFVYIDFEDNSSPIVESVDFALGDAGYSLCIVNTGGNHASLNADYASVPAEMKSVAEFFARPVLRGLTESDILAKAQELRSAVGDRAIMRALHFVRENTRVEAARDALKAGDIDGFTEIILSSGRSSFEYLQNVYTTQNVHEQGLSLALAITEGYLSGKGCAWRVHGGGFAGTIQAFVKNEYLDGYVSLMNSVFGDGSAVALNIRPIGAARLF